jgi:energy-coupling factor transporter ATP-binding protein EcfA2
MPDIADRLSIKITPRSGGRYKSISEISWTDIPGLAVLTGRNGSGKTQLLEVLAYHLSQTLPPTSSPGQGLPLEVLLEGAQYRPEEIAFVPNSGRFSGGASVSFGSLTGARQQILQLARQYNAHSNDIFANVRARKALSRFKDMNLHSLTSDMLAEILPDNFEFMLDDIDVTSGLAYVFIAYRLKYLESHERGTPGMTKEGQPMGPPPWDIVNETLATAGFVYEVIPPTERSVLDDYQLKLRDRNSKIEIGTLDLSSGEQAILQLVL